MTILKPKEMPKPHKVPIIDGVKTYPDGREVCMETTAGKREYARRRTYAWGRQAGMCAICWIPMSLEEATSDHKVPRGMGGGFRDDRQENIRAVHLVCNGAKGSKRDAVEECG